jgi:N-acetyltransferase 10
MGYGSRALKVLNSYFSGEILNVDEVSRAEPSYPDPGLVEEVCIFLVTLIFLL